MTRIHQPPCHKCGKPTGLYYSIRRDGTKQYQWHCADCKRNWSPNGNSGYFIPHRLVEQWLSDWKPTVLAKFENERCLADYRQIDTEQVRCVVCGELGAQNHHFAPQSLAEYFGDDFEKYPQVDLCDYHHRLWHEVVTWYLPGYRQRLNEFAEKFLAERVR